MGGIRRVVASDARAPSLSYRTAITSQARSVPSPLSFPCLWGNFSHLIADFNFQIFPLLYSSIHLQKSHARTHALGFRGCSSICKSMQKMIQPASSTATSIQRPLFNQRSNILFDVDAAASPPGSRIEKVPGVVLLRQREAHMQILHRSVNSIRSVRSIKPFRPVKPATVPPISEVTLRCLRDRLSRRPRKRLRRLEQVVADGECAVAEAHRSAPSGKEVFAEWVVEQEDQGLHCKVEVPPVCCLEWPRLERGLNRVDIGLAVAETEFQDCCAWLASRQLKQCSVSYRLDDGKGRLVQIEPSIDGKRR